MYNPDLEAMMQARIGQGWQILDAIPVEASNIGEPLARDHQGGVVHPQHPQIHCILSWRQGECSSAEDVSLVSAHLNLRCAETLLERLKAHADPAVHLVLQSLPLED